MLKKLIPLTLVLTLATGLHANDSSSENSTLKATYKYIAGGLFCVSAVLVVAGIVKLREAQAIERLEKEDNDKWKQDKQ